MFILENAAAAAAAAGAANFVFIGEITLTVALTLLLAG
jgi:hypothetical protein